MIVSGNQLCSHTAQQANYTRFASMLAYLQSSFATQGFSEERFHVIYLDHQRSYLDDAILTCGSAIHLPVRLRDLFTVALKLGARVLIVAHNHPSGNCRPSESDIVATRRLREIGSALEIELLDHLIITREKVYSMRAGGKL